MRNALLGTIAGLLVGTIGALAYNQYLGDGSLLSHLQSQLDAVNAKLAQAESDNKFLKEQNKSSSDQLDAVVASNDQLKKQLAGGPAATTDAPAASPLMPTITPDMVRGFMGMMRGGPGGAFRSPEQRMFLLQTRLKLDPDQAKAIRAAMDADNQARRDAFRQARENGTRPDPAAMAINTVDKTMAEVLSPAQQTAYQQEQADEKSARAESSATAQVDNMMPLLQLTDEQKEKAINALYQQQTQGADPANAANPLGAVAQQGQSMQAAMKAVLTPDQYALYQADGQVQTQSAQNFVNGGGRNRGGNGGGNGGGQGQGQPPGGAPSATGTATTGSTAATGSTTPDASTNAASATTNAPSATTNAASADAPPPPPAN